MKCPSCVRVGSCSSSLRPHGRSVQCARVATIWFRGLATHDTCTLHGASGCLLTEPSCKFFFSSAWAREGGTKFARHDLNTGVRTLCARNNATQHGAPPLDTASTEAQHRAFVVIKQFLTPAHSSVSSLRTSASFPSRCWFSCSSSVSSASLARASRSLPRRTPSTAKRKSRHGMAWDGMACHGARRERRPEHRDCCEEVLQRMTPMLAT